MTAFGTMVERYVAAWLETFASTGTRQVYGSRLRAWLRWCAASQIAPLAPEPEEIDRFAKSRANPSAVRGTVQGWHRWLATNSVTLDQTSLLAPDELQRRCATEGCDNQPALGRAALCVACIDEVYRRAGLQRLEQYQDYHTAIEAACLNCPWTGPISLALLLRRDRQADLPGCRRCSYRRRGSRRRTPADRVYQEFWNHGYDMIGEFRAVDVPVEAICIEHQLPCWPRLKHVRTRGDLSCHACSRRARADRMRKYSQEDIRQLLLTANMELTGTFRTVDEPVDARCLHPVCGRESPIWIATIQRGGGCQSCGRQKAAASLRLDPALVAKVVADAGFDLLSAYVNNNTSMRLRCQRCEHMFSRSYKSMRKGAKRCPDCDPAPPSRPMLDEEEVRAEFLAHGLRMTGPYRGSNTPTAAECLVCGKPDCKPTLSNLRSGQGGCLACGNQKIADALRTPLGAIIAIMDAANIDFIGPFHGQNERTPGLHRACGNSVAPRINSLIFGGGGCTPCGYAKRRVPWTSARDVPGHLYLLDFNLDGERFCKIGISKVGSGRIEHFRTHCDARVRQVVTASLAACYAAEQTILAEHRSHAYLPVNPCLPSGHTECMYPYLHINLADWLPED